VEELVAATLEALRLREVDVYLTGSRAHGRETDASDWDLIALAPGDEGARLGMHPLERGDVGVDLIGPDLRAWREEQELSIWAWELGRGRLLHEGWGGGEPYRAELARRFEAVRDALAVRWWARFRLQRNVARSVLAKGDPLAIPLTVPLAAHAAARAAILWTGRPYPPDKWLAAETPEPLGEPVRALLDQSRTVPDRLEALEELRRLVEEPVPVAHLGDWYRLV
jgi:predicted nucleotidyltransferase